MKVLKIDLASCFTIWFSARAPTLHPPDLLDIPSDLLAFHKSLDLTLHSLTLFSKNYFLFFAMRFCIQYPALLLIALSTWSLVFLYFLKCLFWIIIFFWNLTILENSFWFFCFWLALLCQWPPLVCEWSLSKHHSNCQTFYTQEN